MNGSGEWLSNKLMFVCQSAKSIIVKNLYLAELENVQLMKITEDVYLHMLQDWILSN